MADEGFVAPVVDEAAVTDVQFELKGRGLPQDHGLLLYRALRELAPWIAQEDLLAIHPIQGADVGGGRLMLNRRAKLVIRVPRERVEDILQLSGRSFELAGERFQIGAGKVRPLTLHTPLYAHLVTTGSADEKAFADDIIRLLDELKVDTRFILGRRQALTTERGTEYGYSVMLHGLPIEHAIMIQQRGLGTNRKLGCGIFIPHKSITPVS
ncbi:type I-MYXAN CRISPR-associated protein Cas6/Cmx6 [Thiobacter aerophilum]|uniref:Type I-MYXAN CRISPR-associated protein Cas6/Cmx6 n=1 Tax=Thiobacter aerophilum TaxID=3121275 RepID=A0ABV0EGC7_9BURK